MKYSNTLFGLTTGLLALASFAFAKSQAKGAIHTAKCRTQASPTHNQCNSWAPILGSFVRTATKNLCFDPISGNSGTFVTAALCFSTIKTQID